MWSSAPALPRSPYDAICRVALWIDSSVSMIFSGALRVPECRTEARRGSMTKCSHPVKREWPDQLHHVLPLPADKVIITHHWLPDQPHTMDISTYQCLTSYIYGSPAGKTPEAFVVNAPWAARGVDRAGMTGDQPCPMLLHDYPSGRCNAEPIVVTGIECEGSPSWQLFAGSWGFMPMQVAGLHVGTQTRSS
jgi:hypothetical protein